MLSWSDQGELKEDLAPSSKQRLNSTASLEALLRRTNLNKSELLELLDLTKSLLTDANSKVAQDTLEALALVTSRADAPISSYASQLLPCLAERLGDSRQQVRVQACQVLVSYCKVLKPEVVLEKLAPLWQHKSWKVKQGLLDVLAEVVSEKGASFLGGRDQNNAVLKQVVRMMEEPDMIVREAAIGCLGEIYRQAPAAVVSTVTASNLRPAQQREVLSRLGVSPMPLDTASEDVGSKRSSGGINMYTADTGSLGSGSTGFYVMPDVTAPVNMSSGRAAGTHCLGTSSSGADPVGLSKPSEGRRQSVGAAGVSHPPAAPVATVKRGGFKDGGGMTIDGELPPAAPIAITSERELRAELDAAIAELAKAPNTEWQERMDAMQRVEGLVLGGAAEWECFHEAMKGLTQALSQQFKERRSTIARQTCHLIGVLARALGPRFEQHAVTLLPTLFGVIVITVAVMAESADVGVRGILQHCQAGRVLQTISDGVCKEKNPKTRQFCASYIVQILEAWDVGVWARYAEAIEAAIRAAAQDSSADTRQSARTAMGLFYNAQPERAQAFLKRLDPGLQDKLSASVAGAKPAKPAPTASRQSISAFAASRRMARQAPVAAGTSGSDGGIVVVVAGPSSKAERRPEPIQPSDGAAGADVLVAAPRTASRPTSATNASSMAKPATGSGSYEASTATARTAPSDHPLTATVGRSSRKSLALPAGRIRGGSADLTSVLGESSSSAVDPDTQKRIAALRRPRLSSIPFDTASRTPNPAGLSSSHALRLPTEPATTTGRAQSVQTPEHGLNRSILASASQASGLSSTRSSGSLQQDGSGGGSGAADTSAVGIASSSGLVPLSRVVTTILGGPRTWSDKVEALSALSAHVRASVGGLASPARSGSDPGLSTLAAAQLLVAEPDKVMQALERVRERVMEALDDPHQKVLIAALMLIGEVVRLYSRVLEGQLDRLLPLLLNKGAENKEQSRALCADVLNDCGQVYRADVLVPALTKCLDVVKVARGKQVVLEFFRSHVDRWGAINVVQLKHWLVRLAPLLEDRTPELRKRAGDVLDALLACPWAREPINYVAYQHNSTDVAPLRRYLATLNGATGAFPLAGPSTSGDTRTLIQPSSTPSIAVNGIPPATTNDSRRQLPSAAPALPVPLAGPPPQSPARAAPLSVHQQRGPAAANGHEQPGPSGFGDSQFARPGVAQTPVAGWSGQQTGGPPASTSTSTSRPYAPHPPHAAPSAAPGPSGTAAVSTGPWPQDARLQVSSRPMSGPAQGPGPGRYGPEGSGTRLAAPAEAQVTLLSQLFEAARCAVGGLDSSTASMELVRETMKNLQDAGRMYGREPWVRTFPALMVEMQAWVRHHAALVRHHAFALLDMLLNHQPFLFTDNNLESQLSLLLAGCGDPVLEVTKPAASALKALLNMCNARIAMRLLQQLHSAEQEAQRRAPDNGAVLARLMDGMKGMASRLDPHDLEDLVFAPEPGTSATLFDALVENLRATSVPVRRAAVTTLATMWFRLGPVMRDLLQQHASSSYHILCIYYLRNYNVHMAPGEGNPAAHPLVTGGGSSI